MITNEIESFTSRDAIEAELYDAIKRGETKFSGHYELRRDGNFDCKQQSFIFKDKTGILRVGNFQDVDEVIDFMIYVREREMKDND